MFAIPGQSYEGWIQNLRTVAKLGPEHISAYSLIIEEGTPFSARKLDLPDEDTEYRMYEDVAAVLGKYGYYQYEISNYAKKDRNCRHNEGYWQRKDYLGLGLGAASLVGRERFTNTSDMSEYLENSGNLEKIRTDRETLTREDEMGEFMFLGLRMTKGVSKKDFQEYFGTSIEKIYGEVLEKYNRLVQETTEFMYSFATYDELEGRYVLKGAIPAQETLRAAETINPPFELSYWHFAMQTAQQWRERMGQQRSLEWDEMIDKLSPLASNNEGLYLAAERREKRQAPRHGKYPYIQIRQPGQCRRPHHASG